LRFSKTFIQGCALW